MRSSYLGLDNRHSHGKKPNTKALNCSPCNEAGEVRSKCLNKSHAEVDETTDSNTSFPPHNVAENTSEERSNSSSELKAGYRNS